MNFVEFNLDKFFSVDKIINFSPSNAEIKEPLLRMGTYFHIDVFSIKQHDSFACHSFSVKGSQQKSNFHNKIFAVAYKELHTSGATIINLSSSSISAKKFSMGLMRISYIHSKHPFILFLWSLVDGREYIVLNSSKMFCKILWIPCMLRICMRTLSS
jgi:hypothetical protein